MLDIVVERLDDLGLCGPNWYCDCSCTAPAGARSLRLCWWGAGMLPSSCRAGGALCWLLPCSTAQWQRPSPWAHLSLLLGFCGNSVQVLCVGRSSRAFQGPSAGGCKSALSIVAQVCVKPWGPWGRCSAMEGVCSGDAGGLAQQHLFDCTRVNSWAWGCVLL